MAVVSVRHDFWRFGQTLDDLQRKQLPFAAAQGINMTARTAQRELTREIPAIFSHKGAPTPFTRRAIGMTGARKSNLRAAVFVKRIQASYLGIEETGGTVSPAPGAPILTPVNAALNAYGNIPRGMLRKLLADRQHYFLGEVRGVYGLWRRLGKDQDGQKRGRLVLIAALRERAHYQPRFGFHRRIEASVQANFLGALSAGLAKAIATAVRV